MNSDQPMPTEHTNPSAGPDQPRLEMPKATSGVPFPWSPEPTRTIPEAQLEAIGRASGEWREYLPHGLSIADYEPFRQGNHVPWLHHLAVSSAARPLIPVLPPDAVPAAAQAAADLAFDYVAHLLSQYEPD